MNKNNLCANSLMKLYYDTKTKRCLIPENYQALREIIIKSFHLENNKQFETFYLDDEYEYISIENQFDYNSAIDCVCNAKSANILRIQVKLIEERGGSKLTKMKLSRNSVLNLINLDFSNLPDNEPKFKAITNQIQLATKANLIENLFACQRCERKFNNVNSFTKHSRNCLKVFGLKRIPFDSRKQRLLAQNQVMAQKENFLDHKINNLNMIINKEMIKMKKVKQLRKNCNNINIDLKQQLNDLYICIDLKQCDNCHRFFNNEESFDKHSTKCRSLLEKREPFESKKQRILSLEHMNILKKQEIMERHLKKMKTKDDELDIRKTRWRKLSERFRTFMRISRLIHM